MLYYRCKEKGGKIKMKNEKLLNSYNSILLDAIKSDRKGMNKDSLYLFGKSCGMLHMAFTMYDALGSETVAKMSRANELAYDILTGEVEDEMESIYILENNMA